MFSSVLTIFLIKLQSITSSLFFNFSTASMLCPWGRFSFIACFFVSLTNWVLVNSSATVSISAIVWFVSIALITTCKQRSMGLSLGLSVKLFFNLSLSGLTGLRLGVHE